MYRTFLSFALLSLIFLTGCGGKKDANNSSSNTGGSLNKASSLPAEQQAQLGLKIDIASALKSFAAIDQLEQQAGLDIPDSVASLEAFVSLPAQFSPDPSGINFHVKLAFSSEPDAKKAYDDIMQSTPFAVDEEIGGKTYKVVAEAGAPTVCFSMEGASIVISSKAYVESGADSFATEGLREIMNGLDPDMVQLGFDMKGASSFLNGALGMVPPDEMMQPIVDAVKKIDAIKMTTGVKENLMMLGFDAADEDGAKAIRQQLQKGLALLAAGAAMMTPPEKEFPASAEMFTHFMSSLVPKKEGNTIKIVITKPDNYDELVKTMQKELDGASMLEGLFMAESPESSVPDVLDESFPAEVEAGEDEKVESAPDPEKKGDAKK